jgi:hypothetical protein
MVRMLRAIVQTVLGLALAATPVLLWVAWTPQMMLGVLACSIVCGGLLVLATEAHPQGAAEGGVRLSEAFVEEAQTLHPMIHHHAGRHQSSRFQRTMRRLARLAPPVRA